MAHTESDNDGLNAVDALSLLALFLLAVVVTFFRRELGAEALWLLGVFAVLMVFVVATAFLPARFPLIRTVHAFSPALLIPVIFNTLGPIIDAASPERWDETFRTLDAYVFGDLPNRWHAVCGRASWFVDTVSAAYVCYYLVPVILAVVLYRRRDRVFFEQFMFTVVLTFYVSYLGYFIFPTVGPRIPAHAESLLLGGAVSHAVRAFIEFAERTRTDAFPSGHTALALVCLWFAWRTSPALFLCFFPVVGAIVFSTVYLHYHYIVDVVAGGALALGCGWLGPRLHPLMQPAAVRRRFAIHPGRW